MERANKLVADNETALANSLKSYNKSTTAIDALRKAHDDLITSSKTAQGQASELRNSLELLSDMAGVTTQTSVENLIKELENLDNGSDKSKRCIESIKSALQTFGEEIDRTGNFSVESFINTLDGLDSTSDAAQAAIENVKTATAELATQMSGAGVDAVDGYVNPINEGNKAVADAFEALGISGFDALQTFNDSHSPSKRYYEEGNNVVSGLANGITDNAYLVENAIRAVCNSMISLVETAVNRIASAFNSVASKVNAESSETGISVPTLNSVSIPRLAQGAVIPPNREFLAVLGDQTSGRNIEAPEAELQAMANQAASANAAYLERIINILQEGKTLVVDNKTFARLVYNSNKKETTRIGGSLVHVSGR